MKFSVLILLLTSLPCFAQDLTAKFQSMIDQDAQASRAFWGIRVVSLNTGAELVSLNADRYFVPASNTKLYSTALALLRLGADYRFRTSITSVQPPVNGVLEGDLSIVGGGDPSMSWRTYPYQKGPNSQDPLQAIELLADEIAQQGIQRIEGDIIGDDTRWPWAPYPEGWAGDDAMWEYGAPVSALTLNDNAIRITARPTSAGLPAQLTLTPSLEYYWIDNRIQTQSGARKIEVTRAPGRRQLQLEGQMPPRSSARVITLAVDDPALFTATALYEALSRRGVLITGKPATRHRLPNQPYSDPPPVVELAYRNSRPLAEILEVINKTSQNLHAEMILREVGFFSNREGTTESGLKELQRMLDEAKVPQDGYDLRDGSGLSRLTLTTPSTTTQLLAHIFQTSYQEAWLNMMPVGGEDGTLEFRFRIPGRGNRVSPDASRIRAKTGSLSHVNTLSGYMDSRTHGPLAFSIMVNNYNGPASGIRALIDKICLEIVQ